MSQNSLLFFQNTISNMSLVGVLRRVVRQNPSTRKLLIQMPHLRRMGYSISSTQKYRTQQFDLVPKNIGNSLGSKRVIRQNPRYFSEDSTNESKNENPKLSASNALVNIIFGIPFIVISSTILCGFIVFVWAMTFSILGDFLEIVVSWFYKK